MNAARLMTCLWFNFNAEQAVKHYLAIFPDGRITGDPQRARRVMKAVLEMDKLDINELERAYGP